MMMLVQQLCGGGVEALEEGYRPQNITKVLL